MSSLVYPSSLDALIEWLETQESQEPEDTELIVWLREKRAEAINADKAGAAA